MLLLQKLTLLIVNIQLQSYTNMEYILSILSKTHLLQLKP